MVKVIKALWLHEIVKIKINPNMCILMYFKIQSDQTRITRNSLKSRIFDLFTKTFRVILG